MKTKLILSVLLTFIFCLLSSQVPQGFNYQAIARDGAGEIIAGQELPVRITIQTSIGTAIWEETHSVTTNQFGLMVLIVGDGTWTGGSATQFSDIDWGSQPLFLKTEVDAGSGLTEMGTTQLWSVPYSMIAKDLEGPVDKLGVSGTTLDMEEPLFEVKNKDGQTVFAVYNEGVRIYVDDGDEIKGAKGGFAIGGFGLDKAGDSQKYLFVSSDSIRAYIGPNTEKASKGGFAIGGFDMTKEITNEEYLHVTRDSTRVYFSNEAKAAKGGFAIGGFGNGKGVIADYLNITPDSTRIYVNEPESTESNNGFSVRGRNTTSKEEGDYMNLGRYTSKIYSKSSYYAHQEYTSWNLLVEEDIKGTIDTITLLKASHANLLMTIPYGVEGAKGECAKFEVNTVSQAAKAEPAKVISVGLSNVGLGTGSGTEHNGWDNIFIGNVYESTHPFYGVENVILGIYSHDSDEIISSNFNVLIGSGMNVNGDKNVCIGYNAGSSRSYGDSDKLYIENSDANETGALIYGEFDSDKLRLNARVTVRDALALQPRLEPPTGPPIEGEMYYDSDDHKLLVFDGTDWQPCW